MPRKKTRNRKAARKTPKKPKSPSPATPAQGSAPLAEKRELPKRYELSPYQ